MIFKKVRPEEDVKMDVIDEIRELKKSNSFLKVSIVLIVVTNLVTTIRLEFIDHRIKELHEAVIILDDVLSNLKNTTVNWLILQNEINEIFSSFIEFIYNLLGR